MCSPSRATVLAVDDEPLVLKLLGTMLTHLGYDPLLAGSGTAGIEMLRAHAGVAAAVLDVRMPVMDGPATLRGLRELAPELPVVFLSGDVGQYTVTGLFASGAIDVLGKPTTVRELGAAVAAAVASRTGATVCIC